MNKLTKNKYPIEIRIWFILLLYLSFNFINGCAQSEESKIKETCNKFVKGRIALNEGDSLLLKSVVSDSLYYLIMLHQQYEEMLRKEDVPIISADLNIYPKSVEIKGNRAICLMSGEEYYQINLFKESGIWKVKGENGVYPIPDRIAEAKQKLIDYKAFLKNKPLSDSVLTVVNEFFDDVRNYFKAQNLDLLNKTCSEATTKFVQRLEIYAKRRSGLELMKEIEKPNLTTGDVKPENDVVIFTFYKEEITIILKKEYNTFKIIGFNGLESSQISDEIMNVQYLDFLRAMKLIRSKQYRDKALE